MREMERRCRCPPLELSRLGASARYARERRETDALKERVASLEATIKRDMGGDYLSLQALYINQLGVVRGHEQDRAKVQAALGNGANEDLWQPGTSWVDAAIRAIQHYENHLQC
jgi:hypothetical protein